MDKQYILRKPIKTQFWDDEEDRIVDISIPNQCCNDGSHDETTLLLENFNDLFVEFDEDTTLKQIEELIYPFIEMSEREGYYALENPELFHELDEADSATDVIVNKLLALLGGTTNE